MPAFGAFDGAGGEGIEGEGEVGFADTVKAEGVNGVELGHLGVFGGGGLFAFVGEEDAAAVFLADGHGREFAEEAGEEEVEGGEGVGGRGDYESKEQGDEWIKTERGIDQRGR